MSNAIRASLTGLLAWIPLHEYKQQKRNAKLFKHINEHNENTSQTIKDSTYCNLNMLGRQTVNRHHTLKHELVGSQGMLTH